jgi:phosphoglycerol transferase
MYSSLLKLLLLAALLMQFGCGRGAHRDIVSIDFRSENYPEQVAEITGLSGREPWGRWSDANLAPTVTIHLKHPLPSRFILSISGQTAQKGVLSTVRIGGFKEDFFIQDIGDEVSIPVKLDSPQQVLELIPSHPLSPKELDLNGDTRKLGIGLTTLKIQQ